jgi:shikimate dehydrogenase
MAQTKRIFGLIGYPLTHSRSPEWFQTPLEKISDIHSLIYSNPCLIGLNVTIPYKQVVMKLLDEIDESAKEVKAVNCIRVRTLPGDEPFLSGFNTDIQGFEKSLVPMLKTYHNKALVFGTGGSAKAVKFVLRKLNIPYLCVSRSGRLNTETVGYQDLNSEILNNHKLWINTTPLGMYPETDYCLPVNFDQVSAEYLVYDLIYNPGETLFLKNAKAKGAIIKNGIEMLEIQAMESAGFFGLG